MNRPPRWSRGLGFVGTVLACSILPVHSQPTVPGGPIQSPFAVFQPIGLADSTWTQGFWAERFELCYRTVLPSMKEALLDPTNGASLINFRIGAGEQTGRFVGRNWSDGDCYKWLEALARVFAITRDPNLDREMDEWIALIARTQAPDGYICTQIQLDPNKRRWERRQNHELYNMGHLLTAAAVHHRATGKTNFLALARKLADYLYGVFSPRPRELGHFGFNPANIMGLVDLFRVTGEPRDLELAGIFVDMRGSVPYPRGPVTDPAQWDPTPGDQTQDRVPLRKEQYAVGHAVTGPYLYAGAADLVAETGEVALRNALERIWNDVVQRKMSIHGGIGARHHGISIRQDPVHEAFSFPYDLPHRDAYNETCANIAHAMWAWRMLRLTGEARYADLVELVIYNSMLSAMSLDGTHFRYTNPLARLHGIERGSHDTLERWKVFHCYCCPPNVARTLAGLTTLAYGVSSNTLWVHLLGGSQLCTHLPSGGEVRIVQQTDYPWNGRVRFVVERAPADLCIVRLRIPGWATGASIRVNSDPWPSTPEPGAYVVLRRTWSDGDVVELELPMTVRLMEAHPLVETCRGQVAVMRGPILYCLESLDIPPDADIRAVSLRRDSRWQERFEPTALGGVVLLETDALLWPSVHSDLLYRPMAPGPARTIRIRMIPYYAWNNRDPNAEMLVWIPVD